jgi:hypothetical protein
VDFWEVNADDEPDLLRTLHIYGIPTLIAFHEGREVGRRTGASSSATLGPLFDSALLGTEQEQKKLDIGNRLLRLGGGLALVSLAILSGLSGAQWIIAGVGALIMFTVVYDRCPIWRALTAQFKKLTGNA